MNLISQKIYIILSSMKEGFRAPSLIADNTGYSYRTTLKTLKELKEMGLIQDVENHRYEPTFLGLAVHKLMKELNTLERYGN